MVCIVMHAMSRPKRTKNLDLLEEFAMLGFGVLLPLLINTVSHIVFAVHAPGREAPSYVPTYQRVMKILLSISAAVIGGFGGVYVARSARAALSFRSSEEIVEHVISKVFVGGASMLISILYLVLESGSCALSQINMGVDSLVATCDSIMYVRAKRAQRSARYQQVLLLLGGRPPEPPLRPARLHTRSVALALGCTRARLHSRSVARARLLALHTGAPKLTASFLLASLAGGQTTRSACTWRRCSATRCCSRPSTRSPRSR
jgi:hypothetical protein